MTEINFFGVAPKKGDIPFRPYLRISLSEHSSDSEGHILLSPELMTDKEIDEAVDLLVKQLENVRKKAKSKLKKINDGTN